MVAFIKKIINTGTASATSKPEARNIALTNSLSILLTLAPILLLFSRTFYEEFAITRSLRFLFTGLIFLTPVMVNWIGWKNFSRLLLCWLPPIVILFNAIIGLRESATYESSDYVGYRFYFIALSCFPFLVFSLKEKSMLFASLVWQFLFLTLFDSFLEFFGVGYEKVGLHDTLYGFITVRALVAAIVICGSSYLLKEFIERNEKIKNKLLVELEEKNKIISKRAEDEIHQLNKQLKVNVEQLSEREFILNQSQQIAKVGSWEYRFDELFLFWTEEMYNIFGVDLKFDFRDSSVTRLFWGDQSEVIVLALSDLEKNGKTFDFIMRTQTPIGYKKWIRVCGFPIQTDGTIVGARGICHDVTLYKESEERFRMSENQYRSLFEQATDFIMIVDFSGNFVDANLSFCQVFGYSKAEVLSKNIREFIDPIQLKDKPIQFDLLKQGVQIMSDRTMIRKDKTHIEVEANVKRILDDRILVIARDVTHLREVQKQIEISEAKFRGAFENSAMGMALVAPNGKYIRVNQQLCSIVGFTEQELLAKSFQDLTHPDDVERDTLNLQKAIDGDVPVYSIEKRYVDRNGFTVWARVNIALVKDGKEEPQYFIVQVEEIGERKRMEQEKERANYLLNERIKELTTLYRVNQILQMESTSVDSVLDKIVSILPSGWQYPAITAARITFDHREYKTSNYAKGVHTQRAHFFTRQRKGTIEVIYLEVRPNENEGPFFLEERNLLNLIADTLQIYLNRIVGEEALKKSEANLNATINNTEVLIWSVDRDFKLLMFNKPFYNYVKEHYHVEIEVGSKIIGDEGDADAKSIQYKWERNYIKCLAGEIVTIEETRFGIDFQYSLSPIIEDNIITGVSVFADNVTERKAHDRAMAEANKQIGELKLTALRSVMSPHFIFNVLNSIQYFIAKNDRLNAINYLSTFSKLIRSVLTHSVNNKVKLSEEVEILKNYIELELTRFENKFDYSIRVDPEIDPEAREIPSLLIQPYVENAILHGLYNKTDRGHLDIHIQERNDIVYFQITDDGIGRKAAQQLKTLNLTSHKSMGLKLTEERLKLINEGRNVSFQIEDLMNGDQPAGTRVTIGVLL